MNERQDSKTDPAQHAGSMELPAGEKGVEQTAPSCPSCQPTRHEPVIQVPDGFAPWLGELEKLLRGTWPVEMRSMTIAEKSAFQHEYYHPNLGPCLGRIGRFVIYHDDRQSGQV